MIEVGAKAPFHHLLAQIAVGGRQHPHIDPQAAVITDTLNIAILQDAQQLRLQRQRQLADFVEEQRAVIGHLKFAAAVADSPGKRPFHVTEQLALRHALRQRRAVEVHQRVSRTRRSLMHRLRHQLLTGPRFAADQHVQIRGGDNLDLFFQLQHRRRQADDLLTLRLRVIHHLRGQDVLRFKAGDKQRVIQRPGHQRGNQSQLFIAEAVEAVGIHAVKS